MKVMELKYVGVPWCIPESDCSVQHGVSLGAKCVVLKKHKHLKKHPSFFVCFGGRFISVEQILP